MQASKLTELKNLFLSNQKEKNRIKLDDLMYLFELIPKEFFCPICKNWHIWENNSLSELFKSNIPYYYTCKKMEHSITIKKDILDCSRYNFVLKLNNTDLTENLNFLNFYLVDNILFYYAEFLHFRKISIFAIKFDKEDLEDLKNIKNLNNFKLDKPISEGIQYLSPTKIFCPVCGKFHLWNGEALQKYTLNNKYVYTCPNTMKKIKIFTINMLLCFIITSIKNDDTKQDKSIDKTYLLYPLSSFSKTNYIIYNCNYHYDGIYYKLVSNSDDTKLVFEYDKNEINKLNKFHYLNDIKTENYTDVDLQINPDIFKLVPEKFLCPLCGKWHKFKTNYLFQNSCDMFKIYYDQMCPNTNSVITIQKTFWNMYAYTISIRNIYRFIESTTINILNFTKDDTLPRIYCDIYFKNFDSQKTFGLEFNENEFHEVMDSKPKLDITSIDNLIKQSYISATPFGIAVYDEKFTYIYDVQKRYIIHYEEQNTCKNYLRLGNGTNEDIQRILVCKSDLKIGDSICYNEKVYFVHDLNEKDNDYSIIVIDPYTSNTIKISPDNGNKYYLKLFLLSDITEYILPKLYKDM